MAKKIETAPVVVKLSKKEKLEEQLNALSFKIDEAEEDISDVEDEDLEEVYEDQMDEQGKEFTRKGFNSFAERRVARRDKAVIRLAKYREEEKKLNAKLAAIPATIDELLAPINSAKAAIVAANGLVEAAKNELKQKIADLIKSDNTKKGFTVYCSDGDYYDENYYVRCSSKAEARKLAKACSDFPVKEVTTISAEDELKLIQEFDLSAEEALEAAGGKLVCYDSGN
jgi:DNA repair exonuclease SbcCD ATPase subunit